MTAVLLRLRSELRTRWRAWLGLALLLALAGGAATAAAAGARRTQTAYPRFLVAQNGFDVETGGFPESLDAEKTLTTIERLPVVKDWARGDVVANGGILPDGTELTIPQFAAVTDLRGRLGIDINRFKVLSGRLFNLHAPDEAVVDFSVAERLRLKVGSVVQLLGADIFLEQGGLNPHPVLHPVKIVGIVASPGSFPAVGISSFFSVIGVTPAFAGANHITPHLPDSGLAIRLRRGSADVNEFFREKDAAGLGDVDVPIVERVQTAGVQRSIRFESQALWALAALIGLAALAILGQAIARQIYLDSDELPALRAIGMSRGQLLGLGLARASVIGILAALLSIPIAILLSPLTPIGLARLAEPHPGIWIDGMSLAIGAAAILLLTVVASIAPSVSAARSAARFGWPETSRQRPSVLAGAVGRASSSPTVATGVRMAIEPGRGRTAVPVRSAIFGATLSIVALIASLLFAASLDHVLHTPALSGYTWDALVAVDDPDAASAAAAALRADHRNVAAFARGGYIGVKIGGELVFGLVIDRPNSVHSVIAEGRAPLGSDEIALGADSMRATRTSIGDTVQVVLDQTEGKPQPVRMRIVGKAIIPPAPFGVSRPGEGMTVSTAGWIHIDPSARESTGDNSSIPFLVRFAPGVPREKALAAMRDDAPMGFIAPAERPGDVSSLTRIASVPVLLAGLLALMAAGVLAHTVITSIRRRRRDLAILKTLGFERRQLAGAVAWQATVLAAAALVMGIPIGIAVGRWTWRAFADQLGVLPVPIIPTLAILIAVPSALILANAIAVLPGRSAARTQAALVLRSE
jgi:ABC-type antimicrobial peptide transport system permease subunit